MPNNNTAKNAVQIEVLKEFDHRIGHRKRIKEKFKKQDISTFSLIEVLEALLFFCHPRKDVKEEASLLNHISEGNVIKLLSLTAADLNKASIKHINENFLFLSAIIREIISRYFRNKITEYSFKNTKEVGEYLITRAGNLTQEQLRILYLNSKNRLIEDSITSKGTINETAIYIREIVALTLQKAAVSIIISHNHPSGESTPSHEDIAITHDLKRALELVSVNLQDHIIVARNHYFSFKEEGLL